MASSEYDNVCRLCLGAGDGGIIPIFCGNDDRNEGRGNLAGEIKACLSIQINEEDDLPKLICKICLDKVKNWSTFKHKCDEAQTKLRDSLKQCQREENPIDICFIKEEPVTISEEELIDSEKHITNQFEPDITVKGEPKDVDEDSSSTIQIESITSNYEAPVEVLEVVPDIPTTFTTHQLQSQLAGPLILASLGLAPKGTILPKMLRNPVVNLTPLELSDVYPMDTADSMDSADNSETDARTQKRKLLVKMTSCRICGLKFVSNGNARRHEKNVHKFFGLQPNPLNPEIIMNNSKSKSVMEPEILMEVDNESVFQSVGENSDPEQYESFTTRHSLTPVDGTELSEDNLSYIRRHKDILEQVHSGKCFCCNRFYSKLKTLLSHLRKKFVIPPFQCYNCLISCSNRSDYVQHIRQHQCRNLYSLYKNKYPDTELPEVEITQAPAPAKLKKISVKTDKIPLKDALACKLFACNFCDLKHRLKAVVKKHLSMEHQMAKDKPENILQCSHCHKVFEDSDAKKKHCSNADCTSHVICELCGERFETLPPFNDHASSVHATSVTVRKMTEIYDNSPAPAVSKSPKSQPTKCKYCPKIYSSYHNMLRHLNIHHNEANPYKCEYCKETFRNKSLLIAHGDHCLVRGAKGQDEELQYNFSCKDCGVLFATLDGWTKHQEVHQSCEQCDATFQNVQDLELHRKEHLKVKYYNCNICGNSYSRADQLAEHMVEHGITEKEAVGCNWYCEICDKPFNNPMDYSTHMTIHNEMPVLSGLDGFNNANESDKIGKNAANKVVVNGAKGVASNHKCPFCNKHVATKQGLYKHMLYRHKKNMTKMEQNKSRVFRCDLCPKLYANARGVLRHKKASHPYGRSNATNLMHINHVSTKQNLKPPQLEPKFCNQCGLSGFQSQSELNKHRLMNHYPSTAKVCNICNLITNDAKKMWYHKKKYHAIPGSSNQCNICQKLFVTKPQFYAHIKNAHLKLPLEIEVTSSKPMTKYKENPQPVGFVETYSETGPWNCNLCPKIFNSVNALKSHRGWHLRTADGKSAAISKMSGGPAWIPDQMSPSRIIKRIKFPNSTPGTSQESKYMIQKYKNVPKLPAGAYCRLCNKTFSKIAVYKRHVIDFHRTARQSVHQRAEIDPQELEFLQRLQCSQCNETFQLKLDWIEHKVMHITKVVKEQNLPQWPCICGKLFGRKDNLKSHMKTHMHNVVEGQANNASTSSNVNSINTMPAGANSNKFYTCNQCRISFTTAKELKAHTDSHYAFGNGAAPRVLKCDFCGFMTEDVKLYQECRRAHHVPTKFKCEGCQIFFKNYSTLLKHHDDQHQNDGVEPPTSNSGFECNKCGKTYSMKHHLKRHIDSAH